MIIACYTGPVVHNLKNGRVRRFTPKGELLVCMTDGTVQGPADRAKASAAGEDVQSYGQGGYSARVLIGLNVGDTPKYTIQQIVNATKEIRQKQYTVKHGKKEHERPDSSFLAQKGLYTDSQSGKVIDEDSVQIVIIDLSGASKEIFTKQMTDLGEKLRKRFEQQSVIVEIQHRGIVQQVFGVEA